MEESLRTLLELQDTKPDRVAIFDDGSPDEQKYRLLKRHFGSDALDFISFRPGVGYGNSYQMAWKYAEVFNPQQCVFWESDYLARRNGIDIVLDVLKAYPKIVGVVGFAHQNAYQSMGDGPGDFKSQHGDIKLNWSSGTSGTCYLNWPTIKEMRQRQPSEWDKFFASCFNQTRGPIGGVDDGRFSSGMRDIYGKLFGRQNYGQNECWINIVPSIALHVTGGGLNCGGVEGEVHPFCHPIGWPAA